MNKIASSITFLALSGTLLVAGGDFTEPMEPTVDIPQKEMVIIEDEVKYDGFYVGGGLGHMRMSEAETRTGYAIMLMGGYYFNKYIGVEARYIRTLGDVDIDSTRPIVSSSDTMSNLGIYVKPMYSITTGFAIYGLAGYGQANYEKNGVDYSENGLQWGVGAKYELANGVGVFFDYLDMYSDDNFDGLIVPDVTFNALNVGATYTF